MAWKVKTTVPNMGLLANGQWLEKSCKFARTVGTISKVSGTITFALGSFDTLALGSKILFGDNWLSNFNAALHKSTVYNAAQTVIAGVAVFSGGMNKGFHDAANRAGVRPSCFVAGTMVLTAMGLVAIENVKVGDRVTSTDPETMEAGEKAVLETYVREVDRLVRLTVSGEEIVTTLDHPFYVRGRGFVSAGGLWVGAQLLDADKNTLVMENMRLELAEKSVRVYNLQVEDYHTYYVGENKIWVHNAGYITENRVPKDSETVLKKKPQEYKPTNYKAPKGGNKVYQGKDGNYYYRDTFHRGQSAHLEVFNKRGIHLGEADPQTGILIPNTADPTKHFTP